MKASVEGPPVATMADLRTRLLELPGEIRAIGAGVARGAIAPEHGDALGRLLDAEVQAIEVALATFPDRAARPVEQRSALASRLALSIAIEG
ncbi:hypothetical protein [Sorangium sp. So ce362]|uniref:hypothetical protein n=1 Tax=Sorangium sp. So ce362 TaxID=3133303 RepID=UPI003F637ADF